MCLLHLFTFDTVADVFVIFVPANVCFIVFFSRLPFFLGFVMSVVCVHNGL